MTQPTVTIDGVEYEEREATCGCAGCFFDHAGPTQGAYPRNRLYWNCAYDFRECRNNYRPDGRNVIFVRVSK